MDKESGILDNPVLNYLPSKIEDLVESVLFNKDKDTAKEWFKGSLSNLDVFGNRDKYLDSNVSRMLNWSSPTTIAKLLGGKANKSMASDPKSIRKLIKSLSLEQRENVKSHISRFTGALDWADPTNRDTMSISRAAGHAVQGGSLVAALLASPYLKKRFDQHREIAEDSDGRYGQRKAASVKSAGFFSDIAEGVEPNSAIDLLDGDYATWKNNPGLPAALTVLATLAYTGSKLGIGSIADKLSDKDMDSRIDERRRELSRLMVSGKRSREDSLKKEASEERDSHGNSLTRVGLPVLLALWALLTPSFYRFGKKLGNETSENAQYEKFRNALSDYEKNTPKNTKFIAGGPDAVLEQHAGEFLGTRNVTLPVPDTERASTALSEVFM